MIRIAIFASGDGTNFEHLVKAQKNAYKVQMLFGDRKNAYVFKRAKAHNIKSYYLSIIKEENNFYNLLQNILEKEKIDLIVLAGYMKILPTHFIDSWNRKIINIHPSLLPKYPGINSIERAFEANEHVMGITIHYVDNGMDTGQIIQQASFNRCADDTLEDAIQKIHKLEHQWYSKVIESVCNEIEKQ